MTQRRDVLLQLLVILPQKRMKLVYGYENACISCI